MNYTVIIRKFSSTIISPPVLSLLEFASSSRQNKLKIAESIAAASQSHGFFLVKPEKDFNPAKLFQEAKGFFALPMDQKRAVQNKTQGLTRGYIGIGEESGSDQFEVKEAFSLGYDWPRSQTPENSLQGANVFPENRDSFRETMTRSYAAMSSTAFALTEIFSLSLGLEGSYLQGFCQKGHTISLMRLFHYFPYSKAPASAQAMRKIGSSEHTDWGFLTLIAEEPGKSGLQAYYEDSWRDIEIQKSTLLVNCGDYLSLMTDGRFKSPLHRVVSKGEERISGVFFYYPDFGAKIPFFKKGEGDLSFFKEQKQNRKVEEKEIGDRTFGEYIEEKWRQVAREGKMY